MNIAELRAKVTGKLPRMSGWTTLTLILLATIWNVAPQQLQVLLYKLVLVTVAAIVAYLIDRSLYARLADRVQAGMERDILSAARVMARALVFVGVVLGFALGV